MNQFLWGALAMACWVAGLFFLQAWRSARDRFFLFFCLAFWVLSLSWVGLAVFQPQTETRHYYYVFRLLAFALIIMGIIDKNKRRPMS